VALPVRVASGALWSDACILNISRNGLLIYAPRASPGDAMEVRRGDHVIRGRVIWRNGARIGLQAEDYIPIEEIMSVGDACALQLTAAPQRSAARPTDSAAAEDRSRMQGRALEFLCVGMIAASLALGASSLVGAALARPLAAASAVLGGAAPAS
jgi:hypothetical protein